MDNNLNSTLARLRGCLGFSQPKFASLIGRSIHSVRAIEQGHLQLSEDLALKIAQITGVDPLWLLSGDPAGEIVPLVKRSYDAQHPDGPREIVCTIYTRETFDRWRESPPKPSWDLVGETARFFSIISSVVLSESAPIAKLKIDQFLNEMEEVYEVNKNAGRAFHDQLEGLSKLHGMFAPIIDGESLSNQPLATALGWIIHHHDKRGFEKLTPALANQTAEVLSIVVEKLVPGLENAAHVVELKIASSTSEPTRQNS